MFVCKGYLHHDAPCFLLIPPPCLAGRITWDQKGVEMSFSFQMLKKTVIFLRWIKEFPEWSIITHSAHKIHLRFNLNGPSMHVAWIWGGWCQGCYSSILFLVAICCDCIFESWSCFSSGSGICIYPLELNPYREALVLMNFLVCCDSFAWIRTLAKLLETPVAYWSGARWSITVVCRTCLGIGGSEMCLKRC